jgi:hypothetical protein
MSFGEIEFVLPLGYVDEKGVVHRSGKMRPATAYDEIVIQENEKSFSNPRYRDILMLSQVITEIGELTSVGPKIMEELFEVDFIYLQMLYRELNSSYERKAEARCPACGNLDEIRMADLFKDMSFYASDSDESVSQEKA